MGNSAAKPYIVDEFESEDEELYENATENIPELMLAKKDDTDNEKKILNECSPSDYSLSTIKGLKELLKLLETHDFEGAQRAAHLLRKSQTFSNISACGERYEDDIVHESASPSTVTSSWSSKVQGEAGDTLTWNQEQIEMDGKVLSSDHQRVLAQLDEDLKQFEVDEARITSDVPVFQSGIPRLKSAMRSGGNTGIQTDITRKIQPELRRSPSPGSRMKASGIPRYAWAQVIPSVTSTSSAESGTDAQTMGSSCMSKTLESLSEISNMAHLSAGKKAVGKPFAGDKLGYSPESSLSSVGNELLVAGDKMTEDALTWDVNISELTGRAKMNKKRSGLPSNWTKSDEHHRVMKVPSPNETEQGISSVSTELVADEIIATKTVGEYGDPSEKKVLDLKRWYCISRPQYKTSCGISSVVSCWNYLFSTLGHGSYLPLTQETAMKLLGFISPFDTINFGPTTGNRTLLRWFHQLNAHFKVRGKCYFMFKPSGKNQTLGVTDEMAWNSLKQGLKDPNTAFIYHCHNHYFCPIGFEVTSQFCVDAYKSDIGEVSDRWVLIGDTSRKYQSIHCKSWEQICLDLHCKSPSYFNIRQSWKGVLQHQKIRKIGDNLHCIVAFHKVKDIVSPGLMFSSCSSSPSPMSRSSRLPVHLFSLTTAPSLFTSGQQSSPDAFRPELGNEFDDNLEDDEVGCENLDSDRSDDDIDENESPMKMGEAHNLTDKIPENVG